MNSSLGMPLSANELEGSPMAGVDGPHGKQLQLPAVDDHVRLPHIITVTRTGMNGVTSAKRSLSPLTN